MCDSVRLLFFFFFGMIKYDQVIRENPAVRSSCVRGRGTETSAEDLVGPPWRME